MRIDSPILENITILTGSFEVTGAVIPGDSSTYDLGTPVKSWKTVYSTSLSGSLTKLSSGGDYLVAGSNITLTTGSNGSITIASTTNGASVIAGSDTQLQFNDGGNFGASSGLTYNKNTGALTGTYVVASTGFSGSLTRLTDGTSYLIGGNGIAVATSSNGSVTISSTVAGTSFVAGSDTQVQFNDGGSFGGDANFTFNKLTDTLTVTNLSGSLTKLSSGADYLVAGSGITLTTGSSGNITITATVAGSSLVGGSNTQVQFNDGGTFGANSGLTYNKTTGALTGTYVVASTGFSGSLTKLASGGDYLIAGNNITLSTGSSGAITISSAGASGGSIIAGSDTQVQFNDAGNFGASSGLTFNKTTGALTGTYVVASTGFTGSLTKLANGSDYLLGGGGITVSTGSNGAVTISLNSTTYATASFTNATSVTVNHSVGTTLYDIEVFDTGYSKIIPMTATATSNTQSVVTFAIPTSGYVAVGGPMAGPAATILTTTTGSAPYYGARAWVNFNGTGTVAIRASGNVSSITDNNVGDYTVNFTTAMEDTNYAVIATTLHGAAINDVGAIGIRGSSSAATLKSTTQVRMDNTYASPSGAGYYDSPEVSVAIYR